MKRLFRRSIASALVASILAAYVADYLRRTVYGRYEPWTIGLNGVKTYAWAPRGFVSDFRWNADLVRFYLPLVILDQRLWHTWEAAESGKYPVNRVGRDEIGKVDAAWSPHTKTRRVVPKPQAAVLPANPCRKSARPRPP
ncbi:MAG: hypothetical protein Kow0040_26990 [Thermogutta sp.]